MRDIKFRAWNGKRMVPVTELSMGDGLYVNGDDLNPEESFWIGTDAIYENSVLMQYTGLKDKNGKEIYEGDRVVPDRAPYCQGFSDGDPVIVEWDESGGWWPFADNQDGMPYPNPSKSEVIGNIYENPELLKHE